MRSEVESISRFTDIKTEESEKVPAYSWYVLALLFVVASISNIDRYIISVVAEPMRIEFGLSDTGIGFVTGMVFAVSYTLFGLPLGMLVDRTRGAGLLALFAAVWSGATMACGMVGSFFSIILARIVVAGAESGATPMSLLLISDFFPPSRRGAAIGVYFAHAAFSTFLAFTIGGFLAAAYGWRVAFMAAGAPGLLLAIVVLLTLRAPKRETPGPVPATQPARPGVGEVLKAVTSNRTLIYLFAASVLVVAGISANSAFTTTFFIRMHHLSVGQAGALTGVVIGGGSGLGAIVGGLLSDRLGKRSAGAGCHLVAGMVLLSVPFYGAAFFAPGLGWAVALMVVAKFLLGSFFGATFSTILVESPGPVRAAVTSLAMMATNLGGFGLGPQLAGIFSDLFSNAGVPESLRWSLTGATIVFCGPSAVFYSLAGRELRRRKMRGEGIAGARFSQTDAP